MSPAVPPKTVRPPIVPGTMNLSVAPERAPNGDFGGRSFQSNSGDPSGFLGAPPGFPGAPNRVGSTLSQPTILRDTPGRRSNATIQYACTVPVRTKLEKAQTKNLVHGELAFVYNNDSDATPLRTTGAGDKLTRLAAYTHMTAHVALCKASKVDNGILVSPGPQSNVDLLASSDLSDLGFESQDVAAAADVATKRRYPDWVQAVEVYTNFQTLPLMLDSRSLELAPSSVLEAAVGECRVEGAAADAMKIQSDSMLLRVGPGRKAYLDLVNREKRDTSRQLAEDYSKALRGYLCVPQGLEEVVNSLNAINTPANIYGNRTVGFLLSPFLMWTYGDDQPAFYNWVADLGVPDFSATSEDDTLGWGLTGVPRDLRVDILAMKRDGVASEGYFNSDDNSELDNAVESLAQKTGAARSFYQELYDNGEGQLDSESISDKRGRSGAQQLRYAADDEMPQWEAYGMLIQQPLFDSDRGTCRFQPHGTIICRYVTDSDADVDAHMEAIENGLVNVCVQGHSMSAAFTGFSSALRDSSRRARRLVTLPRDVMYIVCVGRLNVGCVGHDASSANTLAEGGLVGESSLNSLSPEARANSSCFDHIRFERTTSEELRKHSQDRLSLEKGGFLRANEVILGAWRLGSVVDSAAARLKPAGGMSASNDPNNMSVTLSVGIRWVSSFELHEQFYVKPTDDPELDMNFDDGGVAADKTPAERVTEKRKLRLRALVRRLRARATEFAAELNRVSGEKEYSVPPAMDTDDLDKFVDGLPSPNFGKTKLEAESGA